MTLHAAADTIWLIGAVLAVLAPDFLSRRFRGGRFRRRPGQPGPASADDRRRAITQEPWDRASEGSDPQLDASRSLQQTRIRIYSANTPERGR
jgi:hypothetical protein